MTLQEIIESTELKPLEKISALREKNIVVPAWGGKKGLQAEYDPKMHAVMNKAIYPDSVDDEGKPQPVTRVALGFQKLAAKRMTELITGIPVKRVYKPANDKQKDIARYMEQIYKKNRIQSANVERLNMLFAGCEVMTLWYAVPQENKLYGFDSKLRLRCQNFTPMRGDNLYPLFDEYGDLIALSIGYRRKKGRKTVDFFDTYTADRHIAWSNEKEEWAEIANEPHTVGKIPGVYTYRPTPIWDDTTPLVDEMEWSLSRNGNYIRDNSKPKFVVFADEVISYGQEKSPNKEFKAVMQFPKGGSAQYVTWQQATENLKFHVNELRNFFFTLLQLPDWSYEKMSQTALSGESRKQLFVDAQLKVKDESGALLEFFDRETNVIKAFLKTMLPEDYADDIDALDVENVITPFSITDTKDNVETFVTATGGKAVMSQKEAIRELGYSDDPDQTLKEIQEESMSDVFEPTE